MSFVRTAAAASAATAGSSESVQKFVEALQSDFKTLSLETKKKYPQIKEVSNSMERNDGNKLLSYAIFICYF